METALTTDPLSHREKLKSTWRALAWRSWRESRARFAAAFVLLTALVIYGVVTAPGYIARHNAHFPDKPLPYSVYVWSGFFHYALQGLWVLAAFVLTFGGLAREIGTGTALFTLGLPVRRSHLFLIRAAIAWAQSIALGVGAALLIPLVSRFVGEVVSARSGYGVWRSHEFRRPRHPCAWPVALRDLRGRVHDTRRWTLRHHDCVFQLQGPHLAWLERLRRDERGRFY